MAERADGKQAHHEQSAACQQRDFEGEPNSSRHSGMLHENGHAGSLQDRMGL
jgi:hypothetical protein